MSDTTISVVGPSVLADLKGSETVCCGNVRYLKGIVMLKLYGPVEVVS
jgi:hypothetical protein